ncbi:exodeoxyribonuclease VII large subunit [Roseomonas hellenica]|uniref:Exodeoxyribonuclease 7 large subunit n=1 Tax=Plastoroseomonas hellenica TaxID=2687306 RepID=A0ABS5F0E7_9PROT|nr:exodeoxyribonuclease VII large subunit [Plastoroseomonas hellenica]MBR0666033.1 exodeoxyribonuclease VII large subunit [Plastoroseomonas hellenica]
MDSPAPRDGANIPEYVVSEIAGAIRRTLEGAFGRVRVRGEITEMKRAASGHVYLSLKDENAKIEAVIWKGNLRMLAAVPENGVEMIATGKLTTYADRSKYQLVIDRLEFAGEGALLARIEALRKRLLAEGLFDEGRKRALPMLPRVVGVVTSASGAVIQDIRTTIARRFPRHILIWPVAVQGQGAAEQIARAIAGFSALPAGGAVPRPDVVIVARGGGSLEDLMAFNEEVVVRAAAASAIPLISAVGHETDTTLIDFASDRRAPTPTAAAELAVPARGDLAADLIQRGARLAGVARRVLNDSRLRLLRAERRLPDVPARIEQARLRLDDWGERLPRGVAGLLARRAQALAGLRIPHPREAILVRRERLGALAGRGDACIARAIAVRRDARALARFGPAPLSALLRERRGALEGLSARLESASYQSVLARGFVLVRDAEGAPLTSAASVKPAQHLTLTFADGEVGATADGAKTARPRKGEEPRQGDLL